MSYKIFKTYPFGFTCLKCGGTMEYCMTCGAALCDCTGYDGGYDSLYWCKDDEHPEEEIPPQDILYVGGNEWPRGNDDYV